MNAAAAFFILVLSTHGFWFSDQPAQMHLTRNLNKTAAVDVTVTWSLRLDKITLSSGHSNWSKDHLEIVIPVTPPSVRIPTSMTLHYELTNTLDGSAVSQSDATVVVFPSDLFESVRDRLKSQTVLLIDRGTEIADLLHAKGIEVRRIDEVGGMGFTTAKWIIVGPDQLGESSAEQSRLIGLAESGASVFIFPQSKPSSLAGYSLQSRDFAHMLEWDVDHPLLDGLTSAQWATLCDPASRSVRVVHLPADEPATEVVFWPTQDKNPTPIDTVYVTKQCGKGRITLCQLPINDFAHDPRSQIILRNALDYMLTRPEPTPRPSERKKNQPQPPAPAPVRDILNQ